MLLSPTMRAVTVLAVLLAGCFSASEADRPGDDDDGLDPAPMAACATDDDCVGAGATCCACPEYAVHRDSPYAQACEDLDCPDPQCSVVPRCGAAGECELA